ncbi:MAG: hypothetical protein ABI655_07695 [Phenylobacterium sp.]
MRAAICAFGALTLLATAVSATAPPATGQASAFATGRDSAYGRAKQTCAKQGKTVKLVADQTDTRQIAGGVRVTFRCVGSRRR